MRRLEARIVFGPDKHVNPRDLVEARFLFGRDRFRFLFGRDDSKERGKHTSPLNRPARCL